MNKIKINSGKSLEKFLSKVINESVSLAKTSLKEQEKDDDVFGADTEKLTPTKKDIPTDDAPPEEGKPKKEKPEVEREEPKQKKTVDIYPQSLQSIDTNMIIDKINSIRAGHSTDSVRNDLEDYLNNLKSEEKKVLASFLSSVGAIMSGNVEGNEIKPPEESLNIDIMTDKEIENLMEPRQQVVVQDEEEEQEEQNLNRDSDLPISARSRFPPERRISSI